MNKGDGYWAIVTWEAGDIGEKLKYWTPGEQPTRSERKLKQSTKQWRSNQNNAIRHLNRLMNVNFRGSNGIALALTYAEGELDSIIGEMYCSEDPDQWDSAFLKADHELQLFLRRCRRKCASAGIEFRYIALTSDMGFSGKLQQYTHRRLHHHVVINPEALEICLASWHHGQIRDKRLDPEPDHYSFAEYLIKQVRPVKDNKAKYIPSRNLKKPKESVPRIAPSEREVQPPRGSSLIYRAPFEPGRPQYIRYILPRGKGGISTT